MLPRWEGYWYGMAMYVSPDGVWEAEIQDVLVKG